MKIAALGAEKHLSSRWAQFAAVLGPGIVVMLADTDAGSVITAAQSGAQWGYKLLLLQLVLVPVLFVVQELTVRLGIVSGKGHGELIQEHFGRGWALLSVGTLLVACLGALLTELSGLAGVGLLFGIPKLMTMSLVVASLLGMAVSGSYKSVERIALCIGAFELVFLAVAWRAHPETAIMLSEAVAIPWHDGNYLYLVAANIGAVIMPWMVFYQQSSVVEKKLSVDDLPIARRETALGAIVTQLIMAAVLITTAAAIGKKSKPVELNTVEQIADALTPSLGPGFGKLMFAFGMTGAALVATIVITLTAARSVAEVLGTKHSLENSPREAPWFYGAYAVSLIFGALLVLSGVNLVKISIGVQVMNALLLPVVLGFLYLLARRLPEPHRLQDGYAIGVGLIIILATAFGIYAALSGITNS